MSDSKSVVPIERIQQKIFVIREHQVMLDFDLAAFYQVTTFNLNKAVSRNKNRFPSDFMFQLSLAEFKDLAKQLKLDSSHGGRRSLPFAFTEQGVAMLSAVLNSSRAVCVSLQLMRSFAILRELVLSNDGLARRLKSVEGKTDEHARIIVRIIQELHKPPEQKKQRIGFQSPSQP